MKKVNYLTTLLILIAIVVTLNFIASKYYFRLDITEDKQYTLSDATKKLMKNLEEPITVKAYFTEDIPPQLIKAKNDFRDFLVEYSDISGGMLEYEFIDPTGDEDKERQAFEDGIQPIMLSVTENDKVTQKKAFLGVAIMLGDSKEIIPVIQPNMPLEFTLTTTIKKLAVLDKPKIGFVTGHGEPSVNEMPQAMQELSVLYQAEDISLDSNFNSNDYKAICIMAPNSNFNDFELRILDNYIKKGGSVFFGINRVQADMQSNPTGEEVITGLETFLENKFIDIQNNFVIDQRAQTIGVQQQRGMFMMTIPVVFPYFPLAQNLPEHPITNGLESVIMQFASQILFTGDTTKFKFSPILISSESSGTEAVPNVINIQKEWKDNEFGLKNLVMGAAIEGNYGNKKSKLVVISDGDIATNGSGQQMRQMPADNINLLVNSIDWLADDTGLIELRTKGISSRPIDQLEESEKATLKWINFLVPSAIAILYGFFRMQQRKRKREKLQQISYSEE